MSSNGDVISNSAHPPSAALGVGFSSLAHRHGEASSRAESSSMAESRSSGKRSHRSISSDKSQHVEEDIRKSQDTAPRRDDDGSPVSSNGHRTRRSGGFLLGSAFANGSPRGTPESHGKRKAQDGQLHVDKKWFTHSRLSGDSSQRGSPLSREVSMETANADEQEELRTARPQSMDPAQLVQMALNLSESRKRHVSNTMQVPLASPKRAVSGPMSNFGTVRATSRTHRHVSQLHEDSSRGSPSSNKSDVDGPDFSEDFQAADSPMDNVVYTFSPATLARAEKVRKYFELANEYRRLLHSLPVLKPEASASANGDRRPTSASGLADHADKDELGRQYNPIQSLRNRRARQREKKPFPASPDTWQDPDMVKQWVDEVESATDMPYYRSTDDRVQLPEYAGETRPLSSAGQQQNAQRHRRTDTAGTVITRPENSWTIEPTELLADAYWTEKDDNKESIETRNGNSIFPRSKRKSTDTPKISVELYRGRDGSVGSGSDSDDLDQYGKPSRRRRLMMPLKAADRRKRHMRSRSASTDGATSDDGRRNHSPVQGGRYENIGPLERHMQGLIEKDQRGELSSPEQIASPDRWGSKRMQPARRSVTRAKRESIDPPNGRSSLEVPVVAHNGHHGHRRSKSTDGRIGSFDKAMSDPEDLDSEPPSPTVPKHVPTMGMGMNISPPSNSRSSTEGPRTRSSKLPTFAHHSKERDRNKIEQTDFAEGTSGNLYTIPSVSNWRSRSSQDSARPGTVKRQGTNETSASALQRQDTGSTTGTFTSIRQPTSTVGKFFKGGRNQVGALVRGKSNIFGDRSRKDGMDDVSAVHSDIDEDGDLGDANGQLKKRPTDPSGHDSDVSPRGSIERLRPKPKYHLGNLPSFTSSARDKRLQVDTPGSTTSDPMNRLQKPGKSERFDRLAPPRITLPNGSSNLSNPELATDPADAISKDPKSYGQLVGAKWMPPVPVGRPDIQARSRGRHWSIYDMVQPEQAADDKVTARDIARARALLMCSGIKAREIQRRADNPPDQTSEIHKHIVSITGQTFETVPLKDEPLTAAHMLSSHLTTTQNQFSSALEKFQTTTAKPLATRLENLSHRASEHLTTLVHDTSDDADAFNVELTTRQPQQVKQVDDAIDTMIRQRRRQFRLVKRAGFKVLEWMVLSLMWWIWFLVVLFNFVRRVVMVFVRLLRWLFTV